MKARNKVKLKIAIYSIILLLYIIGFALVFNFKQVLGIGYYYDEKNFTTTYSEGNGGVNVKIYALHFGGVDGNGHYYGIEIIAFSSSDSHLEGITYLDYDIGTTTVTKKVLTMNYSIPITTYSIGDAPRLQTTLFKNDNLTCKGFADIIFRVNDINEIQRISFDIGIIIKFDGAALNYELGNASTWINVIYLSCTVIPLTLLSRCIKKLKFMKWYSDDIRDRDEILCKELTKKERNPSNT